MAWRRVQFGHSEPEQDPCGYRSDIISTAENHYKIDIKSGYY